MTKKVKKLINKNSGKEAEFLREDGSFTWIKIDSIETPIPTNRFKMIYEVKK